MATQLKYIHNTKELEVSGCTETIQMKALLRILKSPGELRRLTVMVTF